MRNKLSNGALKLVVSPYFNDALAELTTLPCEKWDRMTIEEKRGVSMPALVEQLMKDKASLLTQAILVIEQQTGATSEELVEAFDHFISFMEAQVLLLNKCKELSKTL